MIEIRDFKKSDFDDFKVQAGQEYFDHFVDDDEYLSALEKLDICKTIVVDGWIFMAFGLVPLSEQRCQLWGLVSDTGVAPLSVHKKRVSIFRAVQDFLSKVDYKRIEAQVHAGHHQGHRLLNMLGFICETPNGMKNYFGSEKGHQYARTK